MAMFNLYGQYGANRFSWNLRTGMYLVGRGLQCTIIINDPTVSRNHARITITDDDAVEITDLGSQNKTRLNGAILAQPAIMNEGDTVMFGRIELQIRRIHDPKTPRGQVTITEGDLDLSATTLIPVFDALVPQPSTVLDNARILGALSELGKLVVTPDTQESILDTTLELLESIFEFDRSALLLTNQDHASLEVSAYRLKPSKQSVAFSISKTMMTEIMVNKKAVLLKDPQSDQRFANRKSIVAAGIKSAIAVPLFDGADVLGVLYVDTSKGLYRYSEDHLRITATFANILAAKLTNLRLLKDREAKEVLEAQLRIAAQIQNHLQPSSLPTINNYSLSAFQTQCFEVGGDLYDAATLANGRVVIIIGDVSGKGIGAALLMSNVLAAFRVLYEQDFTLASAVERVSKQLIQFSRPQDFTTLFVAELCPKTHLLRYINAGHCPPYLVRAAGAIEPLESTGLPLGALEVFNWEERLVTFRPGDMLTMYTDGVTESSNSKGEFFGDARLQLLLGYLRRCPVQTVAEKVIEDCASFRDSAQNDDITLMVLRRDR